MAPLFEHTKGKQKADDEINTYHLLFLESYILIIAGILAIFSDNNIIYRLCFPTVDPNINIAIGVYDDEDKINRKSNIHRARLSKFKKSKLNGEMIFQDDEQRIYKFNNGKKVYL